ncbi:MAG TPA: nucleoside triphosphate pyrophosphohydrolase [Hyphomicrobiaceae bacterium]|nr:nucleoside triphosphate pyrophosphohydrolase [Hyphomicrobiaceae bacterium]
MREPQAVAETAAAIQLRRLIDIMAALRTPGTGCPWDLEQTFETIAPYTIEEAYEVADAIARGDMSDLKEELGDLLLQVVYHARMAEEQGAFAFADVAQAIADKMVRRHPHVFGDAEARAAGAPKDFWKKAKAEERSAKAAERARSGARDASRQGLLQSVPVALPALVRAIKLQDKAAEVGFDWPSLTPVLDKLKEELGELEAQIAAGGQAGIAEELGDLLFVLANVARHLEIDPEASLRAANEKFVRRFGRIETKLAAGGKTPAQSSLEEMDGLWNEAKSEERHG